MWEAINALLYLLGTHENVAHKRGYTDRQYRNIRRKVERGEELPPRISTLIRMKLQEIQLQIEVDHGGVCPSKISVTWGKCKCHATAARRSKCRVAMG